MRVLAIIFLITYFLYPQDNVMSENVQDDSFRSVQTDSVAGRMIPFDLIVGADVLMYGGAREVIANSTGTKVYTYTSQDHYKLKAGIAVNNYDIYTALYTDRLRDTDLSLDARYYGLSLGVILNDLSNPFVMEIADVIFIETFAGFESGLNLMFGSTNFYYGWNNELIAGLAFKPYIFENIEINVKWVGTLTYWSMPVSATDTVTQGSFKFGIKYRFGI